MKKITIMVLAAALILTSFGCGKRDDVVSGLVTAYGGNPLFFELQVSDTESYGFVVGETTELVWEDKSALAEFNNRIYKDWDIFGCSMRVEVVPGEKTESADEYVDECVKEWYTALKVTVTKVEDDYFAVDAKPVIYLYPNETLPVRVNLDYDGVLTCTYPESSGEWHVTAHPDGTLTDESGMEYNYLYWEGESEGRCDFSKGFCIPGEETGEFLESALEKLGLTRREANEFIVYWLPLMESNPYNLISFQGREYTERAQLSVSPEPDTIIRVFMAWMPVNTKTEIEPQTLTAPEREGFTVVEWGGTKAG